MHACLVVVWVEGRMNQAGLGEAAVFLGGHAPANSQVQVCGGTKDSGGGKGMWPAADMLPLLLGIRVRFYDWWRTVSAAHPCGRRCIRFMGGWAGG